MKQVHTQGCASPENSLVYLDNAATAPLYPSVIETIAKTMTEEYGNPSSLHAKGASAKKLLEESRHTIAGAIGASPDEIYFTSGGTEANNLAITGACLSLEQKQGKGTIITTALEHPSVTKTIRGLKRSGWSVVYLDAINGELDIAALEHSLAEKDDAYFISTMCVQNELGYRFTVDKVADLASKSTTTSPLVHTDAVQAFGKYALDVKKLDVDLMSFCSHKIGGPKGVGALFVRRGTEMHTTAFGGGQERGLRSGTEALPLIVGFAEATKLVLQHREMTFIRTRDLKNYLLKELSEFFPDLLIHSREDGSPFIVNFSIPHIDNRKVLEELSERGVFVSATMACVSNHTTVPPGTWRKKHPLPLQLAGIPKSLTHRTYRVSFNDRTTQHDVELFLCHLKDIAGQQIHQLPA